MKKTCFFLALMVVLAFLVYGCNRKPKPPYRIPQYEIPVESVNDNPNQTNGGLIEGKEDNKPFFEITEASENDEDFLEDFAPFLDMQNYVPEYIYIPAGVTIEQALLQSQPQLYYNRDEACLGGPKLIAEMSSDQCGDYSSYDNNNDKNIKILPLNQLKLRIEESPDYIYNLVKEGIIIINSCKMESNGFFNVNFFVSIDITNITDYPSSIEIVQGMMIEAESYNVQNVVVTENRYINIDSHQSMKIKVPALCAAHHRGNPIGSKGRITPYVMSAPSSTFSSQQQIWDFIEAPARNKLTFYAWGKGREFENGHVSSTGHAFVFVPRSGYWGYGSNDGNWIDGEGVIYDHSRQKQYATDSCSVYITDHQLNEVYKRLRLLLTNTPRYNIGIYDCTSFAMDIADAADVYYGTRWFIQTPIGFMEQLKKYNQ